MALLIKTRKQAVNLAMASVVQDGSSCAPHFYVIINNVAKKTNVGNMLRSCAAFNAKAMLVVGRKKQVTFFGSKGTKHHVPLYYFDSLRDAVKYAKEDGCKICGVEILDDSLNVVKHPFDGPTCFLLGNEGDGLHEKEKNVCDFFCIYSTLWQWHS